MHTKALYSAGVLFALAQSEAARAQVPAPELQIAGAVSAAPEPLRSGATVLGYRNYHRLTTLREGANEMVCIADDPAESEWHVACYHRGLEPYMKVGRELTAQGASRAEIDSARIARIQSGALKMPDGPRALFNLYASPDSVDRTTGLAHGTVGLQVVYIPYATPASTGLPEVPGDGLPWLMYAGKPWAHIMIMH